MKIGRRHWGPGTAGVPPASLAGQRPAVPGKAFHPRWCPNRGVSDWYEKMCSIDLAVHIGLASRKGQFTPIFRRTIMHYLRVAMAAVALALALVWLAGCIPAAPATPSPTAITPAPPPPGAEATPTAPESAPGAGMTPGQPGASMGELGQMMSLMSGQLGQMISGRTSLSEIQQMMALMANFSSQIAQATQLAPQGSPEMRRMISRTLAQLSIMSLQMRDRMPQMTPQQQQEAGRQAARLMGVIGGTMGQMEGIGPQPSEADQQRIMDQLRQVEQAMNDEMDRFGLPTPPPSTT